MVSIYNLTNNFITQLSPENSPFSHLLTFDLLMFDFATANYTDTTLLTSLPKMDTKAGFGVPLTSLLTKAGPEVFSQSLKGLRSA